MSPCDWLHRLSDLSGLDRARSGGKAANLGELHKAGFPVPPGFVLDLAACDLFMEKTGAGVEVERLLQGFAADPDDPRQLSKFHETAAALRTIIEARPMPSAMAAAIQAEYDALSQAAGRSQAAVAVRSSGAVSHPGRYETFLHVRGRDSLLEHIVRVWGSAFNASSLLARARNGELLVRESLGVVVMPIVEASAAGVMFTLNPVDGDRSQVVIEAVPGLGQCLVAGTATPEVWCVDKVLFEVTRRSPAPGSTEACLTAVEAVALARMGVAVERLFGQPQDIEWAIDRTRTGGPALFLLQARPEQVCAQSPSRPRLEPTDWGRMACGQFLPKQDRR